MIRNKAEFVRYFESDIRPKYEGQIVEGMEVKKKAKKLLIKAAIIISLFVFIPGLLTSGILVIPGAIVGGLIVYLMYGKNPEIRTLISKHSNLNNSKDQIFGEIISEVLPGFTYSSNEAITEEEFINYSFISSNLMDRYKSEDAIIGYLNDKKLRISECVVHETRESNDSTTYIKIFSGLVVEIDVEIDQNFKLVLTRNKYQNSGGLQSWLNNLGTKTDMEKISVSNVFFDENYTVLTNDTIKTNNILQPRNLEKILNVLNNKGAKISIGFSNSKFVILYENDNNMFEVFEEGKFEPEIIWDEIMSAFYSIKFIEDMDIDFSKL